MHFHHVDPSQKEFAISNIKGRSFNEKVIAELNKCVLLCSNCHGEVESGVAVVPEL